MKESSRRHYDQCPGCAQPKKKTSEMCRQCKPSYQRTPEHRELMKAATTGIKRPGWRSASTRPEIAAKIQEWWTPERREQKRLELLQRNPEARYHGLSSREAKRLREQAGSCQQCGSTTRLDIHHKDRNKRNQDPANLIVLCHQCHMQEHARAGESGWSVYQRRRRTPAE